MIPIRDDVPSRRAPVVTWTIIAVNVAVFLWQLTLPAEGVRRLFYLYGLVPARFSAPAWAASVGFPHATPLPFLTSMFLHGGFLHIGFNLWTLWIFGDNVEDRMGRARFAVFYLLVGIFAAFVQAISDPGSTVPTIGASGAIAGVLGAYLRWYPQSRVLTLIPIFIYPLFVEIPAVVFLGLWFLTQIASGIGSFGLHNLGGGVAWWAHVGGFLAGLALAGLFARRGFEQIPGPVRHHVFPGTRPRGDRDLPPHDWP
jgi:membrane associated rhomboid family serine protease